jgi:hypothetical protein
MPTRATAFRPRTFLRVLLRERLALQAMWWSSFALRGYGVMW